MTRRLTLAQKLTGSILIAVTVEVALVFGTFLGYFGPRLERTTFDAFEQSVQANAQTYAAKWSYEILLSSPDATEAERDNSELSKAISKVLKEEKGVSGIAIYKINSEKAANKSLSIKKKIDLITQKQRRGEQFTIDFSKIKSLTKDVTFISGANAFGGTPVTVEGENVGYLVYVRSIKGYQNEMKFFKSGMAGVMLIFVLLQSIAVFLIGVNTGRPVTRLAETAGQIAAGDLTRQVTIPRRSVTEITLLSKAILEMSEAIHQQVVLIKSLTLKTSGVSQNVAKAMSHLASSASQQAAAVSETATTVEEMEKTGKTVVDAVQRIVEAAERSAEASTRGRQAVTTANGIMIKIKEDSANISTHSRTLMANVEEVGNIINSVNSISEQSKILAVNASIEAAKAGEFGSGFAVVAQEVKNLAGQSKEATEQITRTLTSIRHSVEMMVRLSREGEDRTAQGVSSIGNAGAIVNDLSDAIQEASQVANEIETAVNQQSTGLSQIASAMDEINISASENQSISHNMEKSTLEMTDALEELSVLVDVWTTVEILTSENLNS